MSLKKLKSFFENYNFTDEEIRLKKGEKIINQKKFVESHIRILEAQSGKKAFLPYYKRLIEFYKICHQE
jgi:hypothetical protein